MVAQAVYSSIVDPEAVWPRARVRGLVRKTPLVNPGARPAEWFTYIDVSSVDRERLAITSPTVLLGAQAPSRARKGIAANDVLYATVRPSLRRVARVPEALDGQVCSTAFCVLRANEELVHPSFLYFAVLWPRFVTEVSAHQHGVGYPAITDSQVLDGHIPLPPLPEQRAIARVLDEVQRAIEATERIISAAEQLKRSLMDYLFTYGPLPISYAEHVPLHDTEIGRGPAHWKLVQLRDIVGRGRLVNPARTPQAEFTYIDVSAVASEFRAIVGATRLLGGQAPSRARKEVRQDDVIFATVRPYLRRIARVGTELDGQVASTAFCVMRPLPECSVPSYLFHAVTREEFVARVSARQRGTGYPAVTDSDVLSERIALPSLHEQAMIGAALDAADRKLRVEGVRLTALRQFFRSLLEQLLTGKLRVPPEAIEARNGEPR